MSLCAQLSSQLVQAENDVEQKEERIQDLENELSAVDKELGDKQSLHEQVVAALKEVRIVFGVLSNRPR